MARLRHVDIVIGAYATHTINAYLFGVIFAMLPLRHADFRCCFFCRWRYYAYAIYAEADVADVAAISCCFDYATMLRFAMMIDTPRYA